LNKTPQPGFKTQNEFFLTVIRQSALAKATIESELQLSVWSLFWNMTNLQLHFFALKLSHSQVENARPFD
jgi:hypothetical protein